MTHTCSWSSLSSARRAYGSLILANIHTQHTSIYIQLDSDEQHTHTHTRSRSRSVVIFNVGVLRIAAAAAAFDRYTYIITFSHQFFLSLNFYALSSFLFIFLSVFTRLWHLAHTHLHAYRTRIAIRTSDTYDMCDIHLNWIECNPVTEQRCRCRCFAVDACLHNGSQWFMRWWFFSYVLYARIVNQTNCIRWYELCRHFTNSNTPSLNSLNSA